MQPVHVNVHVNIAHLKGNSPLYHIYARKQLGGRRKKQGEIIVCCFAEPASCGLSSSCSSLGHGISACVSAVFSTSNLCTLRSMVVDLSLPWMRSNLWAL